ncbi:hypothetical protein KQX54_010853 [Cotesia glomerata]|uniref:Uncharacterized protein n=1 Tax=Cotesia glomerata TaxID=32391 RepID=A0AAV7J8C4_COTGL|nr:hypothetical protein KQX54_010853 [Cotesia glomerata]
MTRSIDVSRSFDLLKMKTQAQAQTKYANYSEWMGIGRKKANVCVVKKVKKLRYKYLLCPAWEIEFPNVFSDAQSEIQNS